MWVCLKIGYIPNYSHLIGIMISKTIGYNGVLTIFRHTHVVVVVCVAAAEPIFSHQTMEHSIFGAAQ